MLEDVAITHLSYGYDFAKAIESKQVAEQEAERARVSSMPRLIGGRSPSASPWLAPHRRVLVLLVWPPIRATACHQADLPRSTTPRRRGERSRSLRPQWVVVKADQERQAAVIRAEGEAEAAKLISEATKQVGPALIDLRRIEAAKEIAAVLSSSRGVVYLPSNQQALIGLNPAM